MGILLIISSRSVIYSNDIFIQCVYLATLCDTYILKLLKSLVFSQNRHPDLPRRPLSTYMLFYMEKKDKVARENPGLEMVSISCDDVSEICLALCVL
jgi:hypothetical protein